MYNIFLGLFIAGLVVQSHQTDSETLKFVQVIFRHGARTPDDTDTYPTDIYKLDAFLPMGWGQLTNEGKQQEYELGKMLRKRYKTFLGEILYPTTVYARSTDFRRTRMSAQLVLTGLFPPASSQIWNDELLWLPIPVEYKEQHEDYLLIRPDTYCPKYAREHEIALQSEKVDSFLKNHHDSLEYISKNAGKQYRTIVDVFSIYHALKAEHTMNLTLPDWTKRIFPETLTEFAVKRGEVENSTPSMRRLNGGRVLQQIVKNIMAKINNTLEHPDRKIYLYSGHDYNVVNILAILNLYQPHFPKYGSAVIIELHHLADKDEYAVKILHSKSLQEEIEEKKLEGCDIMCPLKQFLNITKDLIPANYTAECESTIDLDS
ncbi:hypothetical protein JTB14_037254 [Gonioctena quinquepunctata]|nr:hypothetical protein JTB14_037254 [Gonioctena quinquepunctata]